MRTWLHDALGMVSSSGFGKQKEAPCAVFDGFETMRLYFACKVALDKPGDTVQNFTRLDPIFDPALQEIMTAQEITRIVDWFEEHKDACGACNKQAAAWKRRIAEDWSYFD